MVSAEAREQAAQVVALSLTGLQSEPHGDLVCTGERAALVAVQALAEAGLLAETGDPLADLPQSIFDGAPDSDEETVKRNHIGDLVLTALDENETLEVRENAVRHILACDPARALGILIVISTGGLRELERLMGDTPGAAVAQMRELEVDWQARNAKAADPHPESTPQDRTECDPDDDEDPEGHGFPGFVERSHP